MSDRLDSLLASRNCRDLCPDAVRRIYTQELAKRKNEKEADKAARAAIHQMTGAFMTAEQIRRARSLIEQTGPEHPDVLTALLSLHASTRERLDWAEELYGRIFDVTGRPSRIQDLACGLNPVLLGSMGYSVRGCDVHGGACELVNAYARHTGCDIEARCVDLLTRTPREKTDVCLFMKLLPVLEQQEKGSAMRLLSEAEARFRVVTFPTRSLGGRQVGMEAHYSRWLEENLPASLAVAERFVVGNELCYVIKEA